MIDANCGKNKENSNYSVAGSTVGDKQTGEGNKSRKSALEKCANTGVNSQV